MPEAATAPAPAPAAAAPKPVSTVPMINLSSAPSNAPQAPQPEDKSFFDKVDEKAGIKKAEVKEKAKTPEPPKEKKDEAKVEAKEKPAEKPTETKTDEKPVEAKPGEPKPSAWKMFRDLEKEHKALKAEYEQIKTASPKPTEHPEFKKLSEERDALAKQLRDLGEEIKYVNYERSPEYAEQYDKPYKQAVAGAIKAISEFEVTNPDGTTRAGTDADFWAIANAPDYKTAKTRAKELFGDDTDAATALAFRAKVLESIEKAEAAKQEYRTKGEEREKQTQEQRQRQSQEAKAQWEKLNEEAEKKYPDLFAPKEGDTKWNELRSKGFERVKAAFNGKSNPALDSMIYMKAGAFDAVKYERDSLRTQLKEAEEKIAEYEGSEPGTGSPEAETKSPREKSFSDLVDEAAARGR